MRRILLALFALPFMFSAIAIVHEAKASEAAPVDLTEAAKARIAPGIHVFFGDGTLQVVEQDGSISLETKVVLPRGNFYRIPASGTVEGIEMYPRWTPTANTRRGNPRLKASYGPGERGNAMGDCKITISWDRGTDPILRVVRIHGNAQPEDIGLRRSRGCIRIPDSLCSTLTSIARRGMRVFFHPGASGATARPPGPRRSSFSTTLHNISRAPMPRSAAHIPQP